jgi:serine/threonine-protein kinase
VNGAGGLQTPIGESFAGYRLEQIVGRGGMSVVYRATELAHGRMVAVKVMSPELARDEEFRERFGREARIAASIEHPNVIPIYEAGECDGRLFLSMGYIDGPDLGSLIERDGPLDPALAARVIAQVSAALDAAHEHGLVHRDIKPANVLLARATREPHAYLADFDLVKQSAAGSALTRAGIFIGTCDYAAPEQVTGERIDERSDIYALGGVLYTALTGRLPYPRDSEVATMFAQVHAPAPVPSAVDERIPVAFDAAVACAMAKDPERRPTSAGELGRMALAAAGARPSRWGRLRRWRGRRRVRDAG